jgi:hypothetical protein
MSRLAPFQWAFADSAEKISRVTVSMPVPRCNVARFEADFPELTAHVKAQRSKDEEIDIAVFRKFDPDPYLFISYLLMTHGGGLQITVRREKGEQR